AAMLSLGNSILVQNWDVGYTLSGNSVYCDGLGDLYVNGAIAQTFRGPVGTVGCTGYDKDYNYDPRLAFTSPPKFINPVEAQWVVSRYAEQFG
ncbi:MAG TPA: hypothetical protein VMM13_13655, partial [Euzebya sp.]|nr:hypothetical protein [Euzebya sp.]